MWHSFPVVRIMHRLHSRRMNPPEITTCSWWTGGLTTAASGADGKHRRVFKKVRLSGLGGLRVGETCNLDEGSLERARRFSAGSWVALNLWIAVRSCKSSPQCCALLCMCNCVGIVRESALTITWSWSTFGSTINYELSRVCLLNQLLFSSGNPAVTESYMVEIR